MAQMTITVQDAEVSGLLDAIAHYYPIPSTGGVPDFTKPQWARQHIKQYLNVILNRYKNYLAKQAVNVPVDSSIVDVA